MEQGLLDDETGSPLALRRDGKRGPEVEEGYDGGPRILFGQRPQLASALLGEGDGGAAPLGHPRGAESFAGHGTV